MKAKCLLVVTCFIVCSITSNAQDVPPESFNYSAVARNSEGNLITNSSLGIQTTIRQGAIEGPIVYRENHLVETDDFGLFNLSVGQGSVVQGDMGSIAWGTDDYFLEVGMDVLGGSNFQTMGATQLLSVPYALHAKTAESIVSSSIELQVGMVYQGGIIFHLFRDESGIQHGLIVSLQDLGEAQWGFFDPYTDISGASSTWNGAANTFDILNAGGLSTEAAGLCDEYEAGGFDDWYLPTHQELNMLWTNSLEVAKALAEHPDGIQLQMSNYWSSCEGWWGQDFAIRYNFFNGNFGYALKDYTYHVRAVRAF